MNDHIDQLREWWETAEVGDPKDGDVIIEWAGDGHAVRTFLEAERDDLYAACTYRILARAPKPKPAWHDAVAVMAQTPGRDDRRAFVRSYDGWWEDGDGTYEADELAYVTPLIEAKVTDEMVERGRDIGIKGRKPDAELVRRVLTAALGIVTE